MTLPKPDSLYVHIPFCTHICPYCDFAKVLYRPDWAKAYLNRLKEEAAQRDCGLFSTLFVGGGTPSALSEEELEDLLSFLSKHLKEGGEFSLEANPESLSEEKIALLRKYGVNRVSLGAQSSVPASLQTLGRNHDFALVAKRATQLRNAGITNINLDWMYGFPDQSEEDLRSDIDAFLSLKVPHLSAYSLILESGTSYAVKGIKPLSDDMQQSYFETIRDALTKAGYERYEVSNFALSGYRCRHNLTYWKDLPYIGIGVGAAGYLGESRYTNTRSLGLYLEGRYEGEVEKLDESSLLEDYFLTNLRLLEGFKESDFKERFGFSFSSRYQEKFDRLSSRGLLEQKQGSIRTTSRGLDLLDTVLLELFD